VKWHLAVQKIIDEVVGVQHVVALHPLPWLALVVPLLLAPTPWLCIMVLHSQVTW
jgi:hypothetical protein